MPCLSCASTRTETFVEARGVPVRVGVLWRSREEATACARGDIELAFCRDCGYIWNVAFDEALVDYGEEYNNSLAGSAVFREFDTELAKRLVAQYDIHDSTVVEIGCGDARFLSLVCEFGDNHGFGYDPSATTASVAARTNDAVQIVPGYFGPGHGHDECRLVACRQVLEHLVDPHELPRIVQREFDARTVAYFEVPNGLHLLESLSIWDLCYEHCSHFVAESLYHLFALDGYEVMAVATGFADQFLGIEARPGATRGPIAAPDTTAVAALVDRFGEQFAARRATWKERLRAWSAAQETVAVWGGGARAVGFFALLDIADEVACLVDVNQDKQGTFLGGSGHRIDAPERLRETSPDHVVVLNPIYEAEIRASLSDLGVRAEVVVA